MWSVFGLGNPGPRYARTRHNLGWMVVEELAARGRGRFQRERSGYDLARVELHGVELLLVKPLTYVNRSGSAARAVVASSALPVQRFLVVVDDVHLPFGRLRLRPSGSAGGHNGLISIEMHLESQAYPRLRIGVGAPAAGEALEQHVLAPFSSEELAKLESVTGRAADAVEQVVQFGVEAVRSKINAPRPEAD
ncbi:MAG: aminoacyl-tRNA hydrolase [Candidatus Latescibacterota bacterium]|nr:MAG: aminoacyl-tRNA hydrolase [Candidatus Latescibacterota bacterium]